jgi:hypothetical protein
MTRPSRAVAVSLGAIALVLGLSAPACSSDPQPPLDTGDEAPDGATLGDDGGSLTNLAPTCTGYQCTVPYCPDAGTTTISGTVLDPAGENPLYNVVVYVPAAPPSPITTGASCSSCDSLYTGGIVASTVTDATGSFTLTNVPAGKSIPLVVQIGKWRKQTTVETVTACTKNPIKPVTLPSNHTEGDIPSIAISTGGADSLECLLLRIGVDPTEYASGTLGAGRIHIFQGSAPSTVPYGAATTTPQAPKSSEALWSSLANLMPYDITILSCEGAETVDQPGSVPLKASDQENLFEYAVAGGRVFASHFHYAWFASGPFAAENIATWTIGANPITDATNNPVESEQGDFIYANVVTSLPNGSAFPKGQLLAQWLGNVGALELPGEPAPGEVEIQGAKHNADLAGVPNTPSQAWIAADQNAQTEIIFDPGEDAGTPVSAAGATEYLSFNTPVDAGLDDAGQPAYCGRVVYSDLHVGAASQDYGGQGAGGVVPDGCANNALSPQEKVLEFMLFDLSSCVTPDTGPAQAPVPPPIH